MKITEFLAPESIVSSLSATDKPAVVAELCGVLEKRVCAVNGKDLPAILLDREHLSSTGIGEGVAIPHGKVAVPSKEMLVATSVYEDWKNYLSTKDNGFSRRCSIRPYSTIWENRGNEW